MGVERGGRAGRGIELESGNARRRGGREPGARAGAKPSVYRDVG